MLTIILQTTLYIKQQDSDGPGLWGLFFFLAPAFVGLLYFVFQRQLSSKWEKGIFPQQLAYTRDNLLEAYICLGARLIQADHVDGGKKVQFMNAHFLKHFPNEAYPFSDSLTYSYQNPIQVKTVARWLQINLSYDKRVQVMYFLVGLCYVDGSMNTRENNLLKEIIEILGISPKEYQSVLSMYHQRYQRTEAPKAASRPSIIRLSCEILGVAESATIDEVKKAYRSLVKLHHPDRFATESPEQQKIAQERFVEIQRAYEILENR